MDRSRYSTFTDKDGIKHTKTKVGANENRVEVLANMIRYQEEEYYNNTGIKYKTPFEIIRKIAEKNHFSEDEISELIVCYF